MALDPTEVYKNEFDNLPREREYQLHQFLEDLDNKIENRNDLTAYEEDLYNKFPNPTLRKFFIKNYILDTNENYIEFMKYIRENTLKNTLNHEYPGEGIELKTMKNNAVDADLLCEPNWPSRSKWDPEHFYGGSKKIKNRFTKRKKSKFTTKNCKQIILYNPKYNPKSNPKSKTKFKTKSKSKTKTKS